MGGWGGVGSGEWELQPGAAPASSSPLAPTTGPEVVVVTTAILGTGTQVLHPRHIPLCYHFPVFWQEDVSFLRGLGQQFCPRILMTFGGSFCVTWPPSTSPPHPPPCRAPLLSVLLIHQKPSPESSPPNPYSGLP